LGFERPPGAGAERRRLDVDFGPHALIALRRLGNADGNIHVTRFGAALVLHPAAERLHRRAHVLGLAVDEHHFGRPGWRAGGVGRRGRLGALAVRGRDQRRWGGDRLGGQRGGGGGGGV